jgi:hypothetical protein
MATRSGLEIYECLRLDEFVNVLQISAYPQIPRMRHAQLAAQTENFISRPINLIMNLCDVLADCYASWLWSDFLKAESF